MMKTEISLDPYYEQQYQSVFTKKISRMITIDERDDELFELDYSIYDDMHDTISQMSVSKLEQWLKLKPKLEQYVHTDKHDYSLDDDTDSDDEWLSSLYDSINSATTLENILGIVGFAGFKYVKTNITNLRNLLIKDEYDASIHLESMRSFALFLVDNPNIHPPRIGVTPDGFIDARWDIPDYVVLVMEFLPFGKISFAAIFAEKGTTAQEQSHIRGRSSLKRIMKDIQSIQYRLVSS